MVERLTLGNEPLTPALVAAAAATRPTIELSEAGLARMAASRRVVEQALRDGTPVYGVTRGLGARVGETLSTEQLAEFSLQTIRGRAHAVGEPDPVENVRAAMIVRLHTLLRGHAGASPALAEHLCACLNAGLTPVVRAIASVGASDLTWNATLALGLIGEGRMVDATGRVGDAVELMEAHGIAPLMLGPRDGLALVNHSSGVAGAAALALMAARRMFEAAQTAAALSVEAFRANVRAFDPEVLGVKPSHGQDAAAAGLRRRLAGSGLYEQGAARRLQDPLSFRNLPQLHGTVAAALAFAEAAVLVETDGSSDNPIVLVERGEVVSCGAYFASELTNAIEAVSRAMIHLTFAQLARMAKHLDPEFSELPLFLADAESGSNGFAPLIKTAEALVGELVHAAQPVAIWPSLNANTVEDCISSAPVAVRALARVADLSSRLAAVELMIAACAIDLRGCGATMAEPLSAAHTAIRRVSAVSIDHRPLGAEVEALAEAVRAGTFAGA
jgi:histidine ammonia-lyase